MKVIIMQGPAGVGKSTWANHFRETSETPTFIFSADAYFVDGYGRYNFDASQLGKAHADCVRRFTNMVHQYHNENITLLVDNTNITTDQMSPYYMIARAYGCEVEIVRVVCDAKTAHARNVHGVPLSTVHNMIVKMQDPPPYWEAQFTIRASDTMGQCEACDAPLGLSDDHYIRCTAGCDD